LCFQYNTTWETNYRTTFVFFFSIINLRHNDNVLDKFTSSLRISPTFFTLEYHVSKSQPGYWNLKQWTKFLHWKVKGLILIFKRLWLILIDHWCHWLMGYSTVCQISRRSAWFRGYRVHHTRFRARGTGCMVSRVRVPGFESTGSMVSRVPGYRAGVHYYIVSPYPWRMTYLEISVGMLLVKG